MADRISTGGLMSMVAWKIMSEFLAVRPGEEVVILTDSESDADYAHALAGAANAMGADANIIIQPPSFLGDRERPISKAALAAIANCDVYVAQTATTGHSVHDKDIAELYIAKKKIRMYVGGGWHGGGMLGALESMRSHDYAVVTEITEKLAKILTEGSELHVTTRAGTDFSASIKGINYYLDAGYAREPGTVCNLPAGEAWGGPMEFTAEGKIAVDGAISMGIFNGPVNPEPVILYLEKGRVVKVEGGEGADGIRALIANHKDADVLAEFSLGTNPFMSLNGDCNHNDKKVYGTSHIALGHNSFQIYPHGTISTDVHTDMVVIRPTVEVDGKPIVKDGQPLGMRPIGI